jgi:hypothetical protein
MAGSRSGAPKIPENVSGLATPSFSLNADFFRQGLELAIQAVRYCFTCHSANNGASCANGDFFVLKIDPNFRSFFVFKWIQIFAPFLS